MSKLLLAVVCMFVFVCQLPAQIKLEKEHRLNNNVSPDGLGYCAWCCIEALGRYHKIESLYGLRDRRTKESDFSYWPDNNSRAITKACIGMAYGSHFGLIIPDWDEPFVWVYYRQDGVLNRYKSYRNVGSWLDMQNKLMDAKVKYKIQEDGNKNRDIISYAIQNKYGCMVVVNWYVWDIVNNRKMVTGLEGHTQISTNEEQSTHAMVIQSYTNQTVTLYDPNDPYKDLVVPWAWFERRWTGYVLVLIPEEKK